MFKIINEIVYIIVFNIFVIYEIIYERWTIIRNYLRSLHRTITPLEKNWLECLQKKPQHITFLLDEKPSYKDLANLVIWCMVAKISFVSFYDYRGILKKNEEKLEDEINKRKHSSDHIFWHNDGKTEHKNGFSGRKIHVKIITEEDGKKNIENVCKTIVLDNLKSSDISIDYVDRCLREQYEFPDPDVGVIFSKLFMLFNYPPWQLRLCEFYRIKSHFNVSLKDFTNVLIRYSKCNQRWGT